jgi:oligopeptidase B
MVTLPSPPIAPRRPHPLVAHGRSRTDDWYWLANREDPEVIKYLEAENAYAAAVLAPTEALQQELFETIRSRVSETDAGAPSRKGGWWYYSRTFEGKQYAMLCRRSDPALALTAAQVAADARSGRRAESGEQVVLDENALAEGSDYFAVGVLDVSPDQSLLAYAVDRDGSERYRLRFKDLASGEDLPDEVVGVYYSSAWSADNRTFFYVRPDDAMRPWQVWRHELGTAGPDVLVYQEDDERFFVDVDLSRSEQRILIHSASRITSEVWWLDATAPDRPKSVLGRRQGVEYDVEHTGDSWLIRTNAPGSGGEDAHNFALYRLAEGSDRLEPLLPHRPDVKLEWVDAFSGFAVVGERSQVDALERLRILDMAEPGSAVGEGHVVEQPEPVYSLTGGANQEWETDLFRFGYTSLITPATAVDYNVRTRQRTPVWSEIVAGYDPTKYRTERLWATAEDGTRIPLSVVRRADQGVDGSAPCLIYGYGAYEFSRDPTFSTLRLNLLERGVCFAIAHVRGGGELGRSWYEQGRMEHKTNTFSDFIAAAEHLTRSGRAHPEKLVARGGSAGGLLIGVVVNWRPDLWRAVIAEVPFVDVVTTMSDTSLPLTVTEWEEWGDPVHDAEAFDRMLSYSPYDNVAAHEYPAMFVTAGLNDPRVGYWEPAKWVAKLRSLGAGAGDRPLILRTEMGAGHQGSSGRYDAWKDEARVQAFILRQTGLA